MLPPPLQAASLSTSKHAAVAAVEARQVVKRPLAAPTARAEELRRLGALLAVAVVAHAVWVALALLGTLRLLARAEAILAHCFAHGNQPGEGTRDPGLPPEVTGTMGGCWDPTGRAWERVRCPPMPDRSETRVRHVINVRGLKTWEECPFTFLIVSLPGPAFRRVAA